jgi:hypothetical protein
MKSWGTWIEDELVLILNVAVGDWAMRERGMKPVAARTRDELRRKSLRGRELFIGMMIAAVVEWKTGLRC